MIKLYNKAGVPDILCCYKGRFVALEVKRDNYAKMNETSELQQRTIKQIIEAEAADISDIN